jgi:hypothetical protein
MPIRTKITFDVREVKTPARDQRNMKMPGGLPRVFRSSMGNAAKAETWESEDYRMGMFTAVALALAQLAE